MNHVKPKLYLLLTQEEKEHIMKCPECHHNWLIHKYNNWNNSKKLKIEEKTITYTIKDIKSDEYITPVKTKFTKYLRESKLYRTIKIAETQLKTYIEKYPDRNLKIVSIELIEKIN